MAKSRRLFEIARDLGIQSKAILEKCRAEGIEVNNHMSSISIGLEATIRDWFSEEHEAGGGTAVETAKQVDLVKAKAKARPRKKLATPIETPTDEVAAESDEIAVGNAAAKKKTEEEPASAASDVAEVDDVAVAVAEEEAAVETDSDSDASVEEKDAAGEADEIVETVEEVKEESEIIKPAGRRLAAPAAAKLAGPKVVRIEAPEKLAPARPRRTPGQGPSRRPGETNDPMADPAGMMLRSTGPVRGRGVGGGSSDRDDDKNRSPRRKKNQQKGRTGEAAAWFKGARGTQDLIEREERLSHASGFLKRRRQRAKDSGGGHQAERPVEVGGRVEISEPFTIKDLSAATGIKGADVVRQLFEKGVMTTINQVIDIEMAMEICMNYNIDLVVKEDQTAEQIVVAEIESRERTDVRPRPPVVSILGHVDHGKTSLLDKIREADVAAGEAGGITQHIGAFRTTIKTEDGKDKTVVFLDTPGHQAFTSMRARGATLADLVVIVVAADDGVMPQTIESINHAKEAGVTIVVALNKMDRPEATDTNIQRIFGQLAEHGLNPTDWGGEIEVIRVSAETGDGIRDLIEVLDYQAQLLDLQADYAGSAHGLVIEAELNAGRGAVARVLVREGELHVGDVVVIGRGFGRVRSMIDDYGQHLKVAGPATPVEISGLGQVPDAGDNMYVTSTLKQAEEIAEQCLEQERKKSLARKSKVSLDNVFDHLKAGEAKELPIILKADVQGSLEVLRASLEELSTDEVRVRVVHSAVGGVTETDIDLAEASNGVVVGFQVIASPVARHRAEASDIDLRLYRVIYDIIDDVTRALEGLLDPELREEVLGHADVREVFRVSKVGTIAGCYVVDGVVRRNALIRVTRDGIVIEHDRTLEQLKRFKDDAKDVRSGMECGMKIDGYDDVREGDVLECYVTTEFKPKLSRKEK